MGNMGNMFDRTRPLHSPNKDQDVNMLFLKLPRLPSRLHRLKPRQFGTSTDSPSESLQRPYFNQFISDIFSRARNLKNLKVPLRLYFSVKHKKVLPSAAQHTFSPAWKKQRADYGGIFNQMDC